MNVVLQTILGRIEDLSYHPQEPWLAVCGEGQVCLWSDKGDLLATHDRPEVSVVAFGPQGTLAWATPDAICGGAPFHQTADWRLDVDNVTDFAWVDAEHLAVLHQRTDVVIHNIKSGDTQHLGEVSADHIAAHAKAVLAYDCDDAWLFRPDDGDELWTWGPEGDDLGDAALHPTEPIVAGIEGEDDCREIAVVDETLEVIAHLDAEQLGDNDEDFSPDYLEFLPDGDHLLVLALGSFLVWRWTDGEVVHRGAGTPLLPRAVRPDGRRLAGVSGAGISLWDIRDQVVEEKPTLNLAPVAQRASSVDVDISAGRLAVGLQSQVAVWSARGLEHLVKRCGTGAIYAVGLVPGRDQVLCGSEAATAVLRDLEGPGRMGLKGPVGAVKSLGVAPDGSFFAVGKRRWNADGKAARGVTLGYDVALLPDGERLVMGAEDFDESEEGVARLCTVTGETLRDLEVPDGSEESIEAMAASPRGDRFAIGRGSTIALYDDQGALISAVEHGRGALCGLAFSPSGAQLASASFDCTARLWSVDDARAWDTFSGLCPQSHGNTLAFASEQVLAVTGAGGHAQLWNLTTGHRLTLVTAAANKWVAFDDTGRYQGTKAGLKLLRVAQPSKNPAPPTLGEATAPTPDLLLSFLS